jgi:hypothetical protein
MPARAEAPFPEQFLTVVDFYGEPMDGDPHFRTMADWRLSDFTGRFRRWLGDMSRELSAASPSDAAEAFRASPDFRGQFLVFTSLSDFAAWFDEPARSFLDAYESHYIDNGLPVVSISPFMDGRRPKLRKQRRKK